MNRRFAIACLAVAASMAISFPAAANAETSPLPANEVVIAGPDEPGTRLHVTGQIVDDASGVPLEGTRIVVYQTDDHGEYQPSDPSDQTTARLSAELRSAADGSFAFRTVLPGEYPGQPVGNRHIHVHSVEADGYAPLGFVILFDDNVRDEVRSWAAETGFGQVIELSESDTGLAGFVEIRLKSLSGPSIGHAEAGGRDE